jgi:hypothetical protein
VHPPGRAPPLKQPRPHRATHALRSGRAPSRPGGHARRSGPREDDEREGRGPRRSEIDRASPRSRRSGGPADREVGRFEEWRAVHPPGRAPPPKRPRPHRATHALRSGRAPSRPGGHARRSGPRGDDEREGRGPRRSEIDRVSPRSRRSGGPADREVGRFEEWRAVHPPGRAPLPKRPRPHRATHALRSGRAPSRPGGHARRSGPREDDEREGRGPRRSEIDRVSPRSRRSGGPADREVGRFEEWRAVHPPGRAPPLKRPRPHRATHALRSGRAPSRPGGHARRSGPREDDEREGRGPRRSEIDRVWPRSRRSGGPADREVGRFEEWRAVHPGRAPPLKRPRPHRATHALRSGRAPGPETARAVRRRCRSRRSRVPADREVGRFEEGPRCSPAPRAPRSSSIRARSLIPALEVISQKVESASLGGVHDPRLVPMQRQLGLGHPFLHRLQCASRLALRATQDHEVVRIAHQAVSLACHVMVEGVQVDVGQQGADHRPLRASPLRCPLRHPFHHLLAQVRLDQRQHSAVRHPLSHPLHQDLVIQRVEEPLDVGVHHPGVPRIQMLDRLGQGVVAAPARPKAVARLCKLRLEDRLQNTLQRPLHHAVPHRRDSQPAALAASRLLDPHPTNPARSVPTGLEIR